MEEKVKAFLELATQKKASDIFIIAGRPLSVKIDGKLCTLDGFEERLMPPETDEFIRIIYKLDHDRNIEPMLETGDDDFSMAIPGKISCFHNSWRNVQILRIRQIKCNNTDDSGKRTTLPVCIYTKS